MLVIGNGVDLKTFRPDNAARNYLRKTLNLADDTPLVGLIARFDAQKDHRNFLLAAAELGAVRPNVHFVLCGEYVDSNNRLLIDMAKEGDIAERVHLLGSRNDIPIVTAGLDVSTSSSSFGEGFSNVLIEAQACGVPCVATDIGDASDIVGNAGKVVPPKDPYELAEALNSVLSLSNAERRLRSTEIRRRAEKLFGLPDIVDRYNRLYREITQTNQDAAGNR